jgi:hypothetical protein
MLAAVDKSGQTRHNRQKFSGLNGFRDMHLVFVFIISYLAIGLQSTLI